MKTTFYIKRGDRSPNLVYTLIPQTNLTDATVVFNMREKRSGTVIISREPADIVGSPLDGVVAYEWQGNDTAVAGLFEAEFEVIYAVGSVPETFPNASFIEVRITEDIA